MVQGHTPSINLWKVETGTPNVTVQNSCKPWKQSLSPQSFSFCLQLARAQKSTRMTCLHLQQYGGFIIMELWVDYDVAVCKRIFSSGSPQGREQECFPRCSLLFVFSSFFRPHLPIFVLHFVKCWRSFRRSCIITPPVWSAADAQEEEEAQQDSTDITTKLPSVSFPL